MDGSKQMSQPLSIIIVKLEHWHPLSNYAREVDGPLLLFQYRVSLESLANRREGSNNSTSRGKFE